MKKILLLLSVLLMTGCGLLNRESDYKIVKPYNGKYHPIIMTKNSNRGNCSAFVISDTTAVTAGHCMTLTTQWVKFGLKDQLTEMKRDITEAESRLKQVANNCFAPANCEMIIASIEMAIQQVVNEYNALVKMKADELKVFTVDGTDTEIVASAYWKHPSRDYGFIKGDFSNFNKVKIKKGFDAKAGDIFKACGFPGAKVPATCVDFEAIGSYDFQYMGKSTFQRGISGGPIFDHSNEVVGIASSVAKSVSFMEPILGVIDFE